MYKVFMRHAEKLIKSEAIADRPQVQGVRHYVNGDLAVTDSHRLYYVRELHDREEEVTLDTKGRLVEGNYPDISRLIPTNDPKQTLTFEVKELLQGVSSILTASKTVKEEPIMEFEENLLSFESIAVKARYTLKARCILAESIEINLQSNAQYWEDALKLFKAFGYTEVELNLYHQIKPFTLVSKDSKLLALIMPMRRYS